MVFHIEEELKKLPKLPGVYLMHDKRGEIIYVGKAVSLRNRVRQYFRKSTDKSAKIEQMVSRIAYFEYIITDSELEALILENNLIKEHRPRYNTMLRDDKTYPYIKVTVKEEYPRIFLTRQLKKDKAKYFGPFAGAGSVKDLLDLIHKAFKIRTCNRSLPADIGKERPCLDYYIHQCDAPCQDLITKEAYRENVDRALDFLQGNFEPVQRSLQEKMERAAENMEYEDAGRYRDLLHSVRFMEQKQKMTSEGLEDRDVIAMATDEKDTLIQVFFVREGRIIGREHHYIQSEGEEDPAMILEGFVKQFYSGTIFFPKEIWLQYRLPDEELITEWLTKRRGASVKLVVPKKGEKEKLVELAMKNAVLVLSQNKDKLKKEEARSRGALRELSELLGLRGIERTEAFDISNISGTENVGSMVVYEKGKPKPSDYRKFRIREMTGPNDVASLKEMLRRRFIRSKGDERFGRLPDLIMMDGGIGQVNGALEVLGEFGLSIPVCGMVKDDRHRTRGILFEGRELELDSHSEAFRLVTRMQDEVHRFAVEYHRSLRSKRSVKSVLDEIKGIGLVRRKALMREFKEIEKIKEADVEALRSVPGMDKASAMAVYAYFHGNSPEREPEQVREQEQVREPEQEQEKEQVHAGTIYSDGTFVGGEGTGNSSK